MRPALLDPDRTYPMVFPDGRVPQNVVQLNRVIDHPAIEIGDFTIAVDMDPPQSWARRIAPYTFPGTPEKLRIGKYCQISPGVRFITASATPETGSISSYPFLVFNPDTQPEFLRQLGKRADTVVGNDVWIGHGALILPGARIGDGAIVGAGAVVTSKVPPYSVVAGNPARIVRHRFPPADVLRLLTLAWWDWPHDKVERAIPLLTTGDLDALEAMR